jgi:hypothetical protein
MGLLLQAVDVTGPLSWRWLLSDEDSNVPLADHPVALEADPGVARFADLYGYVRHYAVPDRRVEDGDRFIAEAGAWAGTVLLGESLGRAIVSAAASYGPVTVRVAADQRVEQVLLWPLELAHVDGKPLAERDDVSFVYDFSASPSGSASVPASGRGKAPVDGRLRILAVFSQPTETSVLALRKERYALVRLIRQLGRQRAKVTLKVAQYGVTRQSLRGIAEEDDGWDMLHLSGHGAGGVFLLEKPDGTRDNVPAADLVELLRPATRRLKLAVVSACESAADATAETYRLLGLTEQAEALEAEAGTAEVRIPGLARSLVRNLGCPVVAMRYPVTDEFAIAFGDALYRQLLGKRQPVGVAVARAVAASVGPGVSASRPALSVATPGIFAAGKPAASVRLDVPRGRPVLDPAEQRMAYFEPPHGPGEPPRFVGRAAAMGKASVALASESGKTGVLLHGMAGAGKTACALELAYRHQDSFAVLAFWQAPTRDEEWAGGLANFASSLDMQLADYGFKMASHIATEDTFNAFVPRLRSLMADAGVLLVLDNLETLLTPEGTWRDPHWDILIRALTSHDGESRVILTSRIAPAGFAALPVVTLPVHSLSLAEAVALARELPNLRALLHADPGPLRLPAAPPDRARAEADRHRLRRVLRMVQGHPKLMELADAAAADPGRLDRRLAAAEQAAESAAGVGTLEAFFRDGETSLDAGGLLKALTTWTRSALTALSPEACLMAGFVACLEDTDRRSEFIEFNWAALWHRLDRPGDPPAAGPLLTELSVAALVECAPASATGGDRQPSTEDATAPGVDLMGPLTVRMHPGVAEAVADAAGPDVRAATDAELAEFWLAGFYGVRTREVSESSALAVRAGLAAAPYLLRRQEWRIASILLGDAAGRDDSPELIQAVLPLMQRIADATSAPDDAVVLARVLRRVNPAEAEQLLLDAMSAAEDAGEYRIAARAAVELTSLLTDAGHLGAALEVTDQTLDFIARAGLGTWSKLGGQAQRLQVLALRGDHAQVLAEVDRLRQEMAALPAPSDQDEDVSPWNLREVILGAGVASAGDTGEWEKILELNAEILGSKRSRSAGDHEEAKTRFNDAAPLIKLGRLQEAAQLLQECQQVFEEHTDNTRLASVLTERASLESELGKDERTAGQHKTAAVDLMRAALRLGYAGPEPRVIALRHHNLALYLGRLGCDRTEQRAHRLAAALIHRLAAGLSRNLAVTIGVLAAELREPGGADPSLPSTLAQIVAVAEQTEGVRLSALLTSLEPDTSKAEAALAQILWVAANL